MSDFTKIQLNQLESRVHAVIRESTRVQLIRFRPDPGWAPALNVYRYPDRFVVCIDLAGVAREGISIQAEPRRLRIAGYRPAPELASERRGPVQIYTMEIDYGQFERELSLPLEINPARATAEQRDGWLWIQLPLGDIS